MSFNRMVSNLLESIKEPFDWVLYIKFYIKGKQDRGEYQLLPLNEITPNIKDKINKGKLQKRTKEYNVYTYGDGEYEYIVRVGTKNELENVLDWYESNYGDYLKDSTLRVKPETRKHFGDIVDAMH